MLTAHTFLKCNLIFQIAKGFLRHAHNEMLCAILQLGKENLLSDLRTILCTFEKHSDNFLVPKTLASFLEHVLSPIRQIERIQR